MFWKKIQNEQPRVSAVIVAAGQCSRMNGVDKQLYPLGDMPVIARSIREFHDCEATFEIILVCRENDIASFYDLVREYGFTRVRQIVAGGENRQESVRNGVAACSEKADYYAIHDGARPLVTAEIIEECIAAAQAHGAAAAGVPVKDTIKVASPDGFIRNTPDRTELFAIQTPQVFASELYKRAMETAHRAGKTYTDDCQLVEATGHHVFISRGDYANLKITTPEDLAIAGTLVNLYEGYN